MRRKIIKSLALLVLLTGSGIFLLPRIYQWNYEREVTRYMERFEEDINNKIDENLENIQLQSELYLRLLAENIRLYEEGQKGLKDPFSYEAPGIDLTAYGLKDNSIGYLVIPSIDQTLPIYLGASLENMEKGAVHLTQTSYSIGGINTNTVLAAHRGYYQALMFAEIDKIQLGDEVFIRNFRETLRYKVVETKAIMPDEVDQILIQEGKDMVTLLSCHPYGQNRQRYLVYCERDE